MKINKKPIAFILAAIVLASCGDNKKAESSSENSFSKVSSSPYQAPDFDQI